MRKYQPFETVNNSKSILDLHKSELIVPQQFSSICFLSISIISKDNAILYFTIICVILSSIYYFNCYYSTVQRFTLHLNSIILVHFIILNAISSTVPECILLYMYNSTLSCLYFVNTLIFVHTMCILSLNAFPLYPEHISVY